MQYNLHEVQSNLSLGALHDGIPGVSDTCPESDDYIMAATMPLSGNISNLEYFSTCSVNQIKGNLVLNK